MGAKTKIEWCDFTFNGWRICTPCSPGCVNCYAAGMAKRFGWGEYRKGVPRRRTGAGTWAQPLRWNREAEFFTEVRTADGCVYRGSVKEIEGLRLDYEDVVAAGPARPRVFCLSLGDWLDEEVPVEWLADLLRLIHETPNLDWLLLTKRPGSWAKRMLDVMRYERGRVEVFVSTDVIELLEGWNVGRPPENVWVGTTVEDQARADERVPLLLDIPARVRFLSVEPMLERIDLRLRGKAVRNGCQVDYAWSEIDWVICGGESGPGARGCSVGWLRGVVGQCRSAGVPVFVKQLGSNARMDGVPGRLESRDRKGGDWNEWPEDLRVRQFPLVGNAAAPREVVV